MTHIAAAPLDARGRLRQRCGWCGALLVEYPVTGITDRSRLETFPIAGWVRILETAGQRYATVLPTEQHPDFPSRVDIPVDACLQIDPDVTA